MRAFGCVFSIDWMNERTGCLWSCAADGAGGFLLPVLQGSWISYIWIPLASILKKSHYSTMKGIRLALRNRRVGCEGSSLMWSDHHILSDHEVEKDLENGERKQSWGRGRDPPLCREAEDGSRSTAGSLSAGQG